MFYGLQSGNSGQTNKCTCTYERPRGKNHNSIVHQENNFITSNCTILSTKKKIQQLLQVQCNKYNFLPVKQQYSYINNTSFKRSEDITTTGTYDQNISKCTCIFLGILEVLFANRCKEKRSWKFFYKDIILNKQQPNIPLTGCYM